MGKILTLSGNVHMHLVLVVYIDGFNITHFLYVAPNWLVSFPFGGRGGC